MGHAALLRDPAGRTPVTGEERAPLPRLDAADIGLGLGYLAEIRVLVMAEPLPEDEATAALTAADYHGASVISIVPAPRRQAQTWPRSTCRGGAPSTPATILAQIVGRRGAIGPFAEMVGRFAEGLARQVGSSAAGLHEATRAVGWEPAAG